MRFRSEDYYNAVRRYCNVRRNRGESCTSFSPVGLAMGIRWCEIRPYEWSGNGGWQRRVYSWGPAVKSKYNTTIQCYERLTLTNDWGLGERGSEGMAVLKI